MKHYTDLFRGDGCMPKERIFEFIEYDCNSWLLSEKCGTDLYSTPFSLILNIIIYTRGKSAATAPVDTRSLRTLLNVEKVTKKSREKKKFSYVFWHLLYIDNLLPDREKKNIYVVFIWCMWMSAFNCMFSLKNDICCILFAYVFLHYSLSDTLKIYQN